jgi:hypothetical protein
MYVLVFCRNSPPHDRTTSYLLHQGKTTKTGPSTRFLDELPLLPNKPTSLHVPITS